MKTINFKQLKPAKLLYIFCAVFFMGTSGCIEDFTIRGNGIEGTEGRITMDFDEIVSEGAFDVHITNSSTHEVNINTEKKNFS